MNAGTDYANIVTAAHRGSELAQAALAVIEDSTTAMVRACHIHHCIVPSDYRRNMFAEGLASSLIGSSPWLKGMVTKIAK